jgi:hypothetical protein
VGNFTSSLIEGVPLVNEVACLTLGNCDGTVFRQWLSAAGTLPDCTRVLSALLGLDAETKSQRICCTEQTIRDGGTSES